MLSHLTTCDLFILQFTQHHVRVSPFCACNCIAMGNGISYASTLISLGLKTPLLNTFGGYTLRCR